VANDTLPFEFVDSDFSVSFTEAIITSSPFIVSNCVATASRETAKEVVNSINYNVIVYPNPSVDTFTINVVSDSKEAINISIYDMIGRNIQNKTLNKDDLNSISFGASIFLTFISPSKQTDLFG
jgi:hypothetical protein